MSDDASPYVPPKPPRGLRAPGRALWNRITRDYELRSDELENLHVAAVTLDELRVLEAELKAGGPTVIGPRRRQVANPLHEEVRRHRGVFLRALAGVHMAEADTKANHDAFARTAAGRALRAMRKDRAG